MRLKTGVSEFRGARSASEDARRRSSKARRKRASAPRLEIAAQVRGSSERRILDRAIEDRSHPRPSEIEGHRDRNQTVVFAERTRRQVATHVTNPVGPRRVEREAKRVRARSIEPQGIAGQDGSFALEELDIEPVRRVRIQGLRFMRQRERLTQMIRVEQRRDHLLRGGTHDLVGDASRVGSTMEAK